MPDQPRRDLGALPVDTVYAGGSTTPFDYFDDINSVEAVRSQRRGSATVQRIAPGASIPLGAPGELTLARKIAEWPRQVEIAAAAHEPHRVAFYLHELASDFHALQHQGKLDPGLRFIREDDAGLSHARLALVRATQLVIRAGLGILGVTPMDEMR